METERAEEFRALLQQRLDMLLREAGEVIGALTGERAPEADPVDIASEETTRDFALRLQDRDRKLIQKVLEALERLERGEYGICVACGEDIDERRLRARPIATHCIDCQTEMEQVERTRKVF